MNALRDAAVIGRDFDPDLLEKAADLDGERLIAALDEGEQARILKGPSGRRDVTWRFTHPLIRQALIGAMPLIRRQRLHLRVAEAMARRDESSQMDTAAIAHHLYCAGRLADSARTARALDHGRRRRSRGVCDGGGAAALSPRARGAAGVGRSRRQEAGGPGAVGGSARRRRRSRRGDGTL